jgi:hypothetical protein
LFIEIFLLAIELSRKIIKGREQRRAHGRKETREQQKQKTQFYIKTRENFHHKSRYLAHNSGFQEIARSLIEFENAREKICVDS